MSDDEGEDYGDYEDLGAPGEPADEEGQASADPEAEADADEGGGPGARADADEEADEEDEVGLLEDAAGTDAEDESIEEPGPEPIDARPERQKVDPILRMSNNPRTVQVVAPEDRVTDSRLHKSEAAFIIATRAQEIAKYATRFTDGQGLAESSHDPVALAFDELYARRCPFILRRPICTGPGGELVVEEWVVREMTLPTLTPPVPLGGTGGRAPAARRR